MDDETKTDEAPDACPICFNGFDASKAKRKTYVMQDKRKRDFHVKCVRTVLADLWIRTPKVGEPI